MYIYITPKLFTKEVACLAASSWTVLATPTWEVFRELVTCCKFRQVCVPGPLTAHDQAALAAGSILINKV